MKILHHHVPLTTLFLFLILTGVSNPFCCSIQNDIKAFVYQCLVEVVPLEIRTTMISPDIMPSWYIIPNSIQGMGRRLFEHQLTSVLNVSQTILL